MPDTILIAELYGPVLQGEGALAGKASHFIRTAGCAYRCAWCDSMHAVDPDQIAATARRLTSEEIIEAVNKLPASPWTTLSGGDPVAWDLEKIVLGLRLSKMQVAVETQGALWRDWLEHCDLITCSPKPPSSGMASRLDMAILRKYEARLNSRLVFKIVAFDEADLDFAERLHRIFAKVPLYLTSGTPQHGTSLLAAQMATIDGYREIAEAVLSRPALRDATVLCQQHVLLYGRALGR
jgi:7-carboxy-7-deazaguanine synthase